MTSAPVAVSDRQDWIDVAKGIAITECQLGRPRYVVRAAEFEPVVHLRATDLLHAGLADAAMAAAPPDRLGRGARGAVWCTATSPARPGTKWASIWYS